MQMLIRPAILDDALDIARVNVEGWRTAYKNVMPLEYLAALSIEARNANWREILEKQSANEITFVAELEEMIVGYVSCGPERTGDTNFVGEIYSIYFLEQYQRRGIGTSLLQHAVQFLLERNFKSMKICVLHDNPYRTFYERHAGKIISEKSIAIDRKPLVEIAYGWSDLAPAKPAAQK